MKSAAILFAFLFVVARSNSQHLSQVSFSGASGLAYFTLQTDQDVMIRLSNDGKILEWGMEVMSLQGNYFSPRLQPFMGRIDYYGPEADSVFRGKVKSIGTCMITYYAAYEMDEKAGKTRSVGTLMLDYYSRYDDKILRGKLKYIGNRPVEYYTSFADESIRGKLRAIGNSVITYYSVFDDRLNQGKIKSIGGAYYAWYSIGDRSDMRGGLKTGLYRQQIGGVVYILNSY